MTTPVAVTESMKMFRGVSILIVEDSKIFRGIYEIYLSELGCELAFAVNGWEALEYLKHREPNIILLDMDMPEMDGPTFLRYFRQTSISKRIPVVIASSRDPNQVEQPALSTAVGYLKKPFGPAKLRDIVQNNVKGSVALA